MTWKFTCSLLKFDESNNLTRNLSLTCMWQAILKILFDFACVFKAALNKYRTTILWNWNSIVFWYSLSIPKSGRLVFVKLRWAIHFATIYIFMLLLCSVSEKKNVLSQFLFVWIFYFCLYYTSYLSIFLIADDVLKSMDTISLCNEHVPRPAQHSAK